MSTKPQIELFLENESGTQQVAYPFVESDHVSLSNGMDIDTMIRQDVSMPTVAHEDLSFKVGVGDQDVSSAIVDSSVAEMTIKGKTYQNILPEPSTHVLTNNKEMFKVNEGLDPNVEIVDGVSKSAILSGQTLVNLTKTANNEITLDKNNWNKLYNSKTNLEKGKSYLLQFEVVNIQGEISGVGAWYSASSDNNKYFSSTKKTVGIHKIKVNQVLDGEISGIRLYILNNDRVDGVAIAIKNVMIIEYQEEMENWDIPYFEGMQSVKMPVLTTTGKNLFEEEWVQGTINAAHANFITTKNIINVPSGKTLTFSNSLSLPIQDYHLYYNGEFIQSITSYRKNTVAIPSNANGIKITIYNSGGINPSSLTFAQLEEGTTPTTYEPYKSNILHTPEEVVLRSLPNGVKDTLNLNTGEYVKRIGEITFKNQTTWEIAGGYPNLYYYNTNDIGNANIYVGSGIIPNLYCDKVAVTSYSGLQQSTSGVKISNRGKEGTHSIAVYNSDITDNVVDFKAWLTQNPFTVQYELATPVVKTVDLSSSGNWEKVVLDGSEDVAKHLSGNFAYYTYGNSSITNVLPYASGGRAFASHTLTGSTGANNLVTNYKYIVSPKTTGTTGLCFSLDGSMTAEEAKAFLSQNPITVWYQTATHQDSTQVKQPIFFKDGHIQLSSGADNSLIPTLDYQAKTSNSYVMDLMKTNTKYTMKAKSASGTFTIDGTSYGAGTNGTFTTPTSMTNKLLVMSNKTNEEVMILEGDVVSKTIPYFKGIRSAFEGESKIEVLSTGKNLFDGELFKGYFYGNIGSVHTIKTSENAYYTNTQKVKPNAQYLISFIGKTEKNYIYCRQLDKNGVTLNQTSQNFANGYMMVNTVDNCCSLVLCTHANYEFAEPPLFQIEESSSSISTAYEPYKSNNTKIPLLSSLRSLPNGVCDELIIDRENNKAKIIQRVGVEVLDGSAHEAWGSTANDDNGVRFSSDVNNMYAFPKTNGNPDGKVFTNSLLPCVFTTKTKYVPYKQAFSVWDNKIVLYLEPSIANISQLRSYLSQNPITVQYELATPIITEVDLEGFPYVYKDGHIFLNGEIIPVTEIKYSINQSHMIEASNQDIMRHQKEIDYLYKLIGEYVRVDYKNTLLSLNLELK